MLIAYFTVRLLKSDSPHWWLVIGAFVGLGLLTKYAIVFFISGIFGGGPRLRWPEFWKKYQNFG
jgi:4-amino-4-deoxy-L-arabinose transferase-like glycosyltransferase